MTHFGTLAFHTKATEEALATMRDRRNAGPLYAVGTGRAVIIGTTGLGTDRADIGTIDAHARFTLTVRAAGFAEIHWPRAAFCGGRTVDDGQTQTPRKAVQVATARSAVRTGAISFARTCAEQDITERLDADQVIGAVPGCLTRGAVQPVFLTDTHQWPAKELER